MQHEPNNAVSGTAFLDALQSNPFTPLAFGGIVVAAIIGALFFAMRNRDKYDTDSPSSYLSFTLVLFLAIIGIPVFGHLILNVVL